MLNIKLYLIYDINWPRMRSRPIYNVKFYKRSYTRMHEYR